MLNSIIGFSIRHKVLVAFMVLCLAGWGIYSMSRLPIDAVPDITNNQVQVITQSSNLASQEIEKLITYPIEVATANIPGLEETRSISRFGLSVVTLVFNDDVDIYWARAQVSEKLQQAAGMIPEGVGHPELGPVSTGLSEIYQYTIEPDQPADSSWDLYELRTVQDWLLKRELLRVPGVADVSSFGGYVKQYHVRVNPRLLQSLHVSLEEVYTALRNSNSNTGGSYIEKTDKAYFIRGIGLAESISDIENIVIKNRQGAAVLIKQLGRVEISNAIRHGAMTSNGKGEAVGGIILMLKGENSSQVIELVKAKMKDLEKSLPKGLHVEVFLDREVLVKKAIGTVAQNLLEGGLIVIFVLVLLLGNLRAGFIVASVIPLSMLFAISLMRVFGVSGNLMSLGAIDFGLIVDGAVIIVEIVVRKIHERSRLGAFGNRQEFELTVQKGASEIMSSAVFGQVIILIVYLPILSLSGIEGKMFKPMALTVAFAIIGAFIFSLTYVPMMSALLLKSDTVEKENFAERLIARLKRWYLPRLQWFLDHSRLVLVASLLLLLGSLVLFLRLGGEFIPQLDEGDYALETRLLPGSSLTQSIEVSKIVEQKLLQAFPDEIKTVVAKIGTSEIPTDPMPIEAMDVMLVMHERDHWKKADNKAEMDEQIDEVLAGIPGVAFSLQQPIQMRFNELMTNAKTDVVIKLYGEDLDLLSSKADEITEVIKHVEGLRDLQAQKLVGLPQVQIIYKPVLMANYGISVQKINEYIETALAGKKAGTIYEQEKAFDLVLKFAEDSKDQLRDIENLFIPAANGTEVPLKELAEIKIAEGPAEISRDNTKRKINIGFNVRGRDVESVVKEIQTLLDKKVELPPAYHLHYGGQFENLQHARQRLLLVVPLALALIFFLLYLSFASIRQGLLIFSAIPLSIIGGVFSLWLRNMPFSISAGVGFIALFGVAVLNGIVLIAHINLLEKEGIADVRERLIQAVSDRFRPVLMTALVASLGFLPMAISNGAGAEVQKPLATVVIGGLISSTLLTLFILPVLYFVSRGTRVKVPAKLLLLGLLILPGFSKGQRPPPGIQECIDSALHHYPLIQAAADGITQQKALMKSSWSLPALDVLFQSPQGSSYTPAILQSIDFPAVYQVQRQLGQAGVKLAEEQKKLSELELKRKVRETYDALCYQASLLKELEKQDSIFRNLYRAALVLHNNGSLSKLDLLHAENEHMAAESRLRNAHVAFEIQLHSLRIYTGIKCFISFHDLQLKRWEKPRAGDTGIPSHPLTQVYQQQKMISEKSLRLEKWKMAPGLSFGYFNQAGSNTPVQQRWQYGFKIPLLFWNNLQRIEAARMQVRRAAKEWESSRLQMEMHTMLTEGNLGQAEQSLLYYEQHALEQARLIYDHSMQAFKAGEIGYFQYLQSLNKAFAIQVAYLDALKQYNEQVIALQYVKGE